MVARKQHFLSICLLALALSISMIEYVTYSPTTTDGELMVPPSEQYDDVVPKDENEEATNSSTQGNSPKEQDENIRGSNQKLPEKQIASDNVSPKELKSFVMSNEYKAVVSAGNTVGSILGNLGFDKNDIHLASKALSKVFNLKNLKVGQELVIRGKRDMSGNLTLNGLEIQPAYGSKIVVIRTNSGFKTEKADVPLKKVVRSVSGSISPKSPEVSLKQCGVKTPIAREALRNLSQVVDIKRSRTPIEFEFLYRDFYKADGNIARSPELMYISALVDGGKIIRLYKFTDSGTSEYIDSNGVIIKTKATSKSMLAPPLSCMKVTSPFGIRHTPNGRTRRHIGIDLSACIGTPIRATASGVVTKASYYSGYGLYVNIKHNGDINTAYGHLKRIVVRSGQHVAQGQIIGYSGISGNSRGAHLHYEVWKNGSPINPMSFVKQEPQKLTGNRLYRFNQFKKEVSLQIVGLTRTGKNKASNKV